MAGRQDKQGMLQNLPSDLGDKATKRYKKLWKDDPKKARQFLKGKGYNLADVRAANTGGQGEGTEEQPPSPYDMTDGASAVDVSLDVSRGQGDDWIKANRGGAEGVYGGTNDWVQNPDGSWRQVTKASETGQGIIDAEDDFSLGARKAGQDISGQAFDNYRQPYNFNNMSQVYGQGDLKAARQQASQNVWDRGMSRFQPEMDRESADFEEMAANKGWVPGSKVYEDQKAIMKQGFNDQRERLGSQAEQAGLQEFNTMYGQSVNERNRQIGEMDTLRDRPLQEAQTLMNTGPGARMDQFNDYGAVNFNQVNPMDAYGIDAQRFINEQNLSFEERMQRSQQRWENRQRNQTQGWQSGENALDRQAQLNAIHASKPPAGSPGLSPEAKLQMERDQLLWERDNGFRPSGNQGSSSSSGWGSLAGGIAQGVGAGIGNWLGG